MILNLINHWALETRQIDDNRDVVYEISNDQVVTESIEAAVAEQKEKRKKKRKIIRQT